MGKPEQKQDHYWYIYPPSQTPFNTCVFTQPTNHPRNQSRQHHHIPMASESTSCSSSVSTLESMHGYGESWFENLNKLAVEYIQRSESKQNKAAPTMHCYGDSWFENLNHQRGDFERRMAPQHERQSQQEMHNYGSSWFDKFEPMWEDWQHVKRVVDIEKLEHEIDSDDESCELGM